MRSNNVNDLVNFLFFRNVLGFLFPFVAKITRKLVSKAIYAKVFKAASAFFHEPALGARNAQYLFASGALMPGHFTDLRFANWTFSKEMFFLFIYFDRDIFYYRSERRYFFCILIFDFLEYEVEALCVFVLLKILECHFRSTFSASIGPLWAVFEVELYFAL